MDRSLEQEIAAVLNRYSADNGSNTPDFILAEYLLECLAAFNAATRARGEWYGHLCAPGQCAHEERV